MYEPPKYPPVEREPLAELQGLVFGTMFLLAIIGTVLWYLAPLFFPLDPPPPW